MTLQQSMRQAVQDYPRQKVIAPKPSVPALL